MTVFGANSSRPTGSFRQRQKPNPKTQRQTKEEKGKPQSGTSYFAQNRNFLLCLDRECEFHGDQIATPLGWILRGGGTPRRGEPAAAACGHSSKTVLERNESVSHILDEYSQ